MNNGRDRKLVYDLPTRVFHWLFLVLFLSAFLIAKNVDDESVVFTYHMLIGLNITFLILWRIIWGFIGTKYARFSHFALRPSDLFLYMKEIWKGSQRRWAGHNPASSWAAVLMIALGLFLGVTGVLMAMGINKESFEDLHEIAANSFMVVAVLHILGVLLHTFRYREMIGLSMIDGKKDKVMPNEMISSPRPLMAVFLLVIMGIFGISVYKKYDQQTRSLHLFGITLSLGEENEDFEQED